MIDNPQRVTRPLRRHSPCVTLADYLITLCVGRTFLVAGASHRVSEKTPRHHCGFSPDNPRDARSELHRLS